MNNCEQVENKLSDLSAVELVDRRLLDFESDIQQYDNDRLLQTAAISIAELTNSGIGLAEFYPQLHEIIARVTCAETFLVALIDHPSQSIVYPYLRHGNQSIELSPRRFEPTEPVNTLAELVLQQRQAIRFNRQDLQHLQDSKGLRVDWGEMPHDWLGVPMIKGGDLLGAIVVQSNSDGFHYQSVDQQLLAFIAQHIATALQNKKNTESLRKAHEQLQLKNHELNEVNERVIVANSELKKLLDERKTIERQLTYNAYHDSLTELPNRTLLLHKLEQLLAAGERSRSFAVLFLDLDRFKIVNDSLGHLTGDGLLKETAARLKACIRPQDVVARFGGDEFCVLIDHPADERTIKEIVDRILYSISKPVVLDGQQVITSTSIGVTHSSLGYENPDEMLRDADTALYQAKSSGKSQCQFFNTELREKAINRLRLEQDLRTAIAQNQLDIYYQPIIDLRTNKVHSMEALARWKHPKLGYIRPTTFITLAEEIHLIQDIGLFVLESSVRQLAGWRESIPGARDLNINVNLSSQQIEPHLLVKVVRNVIDRTGIPADKLKLELTETALLNNLCIASEILNQIAEFGVQLVLDDFGTGYSSLNYLNRLPLNELKIDLSFVRNIQVNQRNMAIVQMIVALASVLKLNVVAEGIESRGELNVLRALNVNWGQGYLFSRPLPEDKATQFLQERLAAQSTPVKEELASPRMAGSVYSNV